MEPLQSILNLYQDKESILKHYLPSTSAKYLENHEYVYELDTLFLNDRLVFIKKSTGKIYKKGVIIKLTEDKITIKNGTNISLPKNEYYLFVLPIIYFEYNFKSFYLRFLKYFTTSCL